MCFFALNGEAIKKCGTAARAVYFAFELKQIIKKHISETELQAINESKKVFGGSVIE